MTSNFKNIQQHTKRERRKVTNKWKKIYITILILIFTKKMITIYVNTSLHVIRL